jgi:hypothetical protein
MENRVQQPAPVQTRQFRIVRIGAEPGRRRSLPPARTSTFNSPQPAPEELETPSQFTEDHSPAARARKARRRLRRLFDAARQKAKGRARLCRADEYEVLRSAYRAVRAWRSDGVHEQIERELRAEAEVAVSRRSNLFLVLIRCALPSLDIKRASKWAAALDTADRQDIRSKHLSAFLHHSGGIEGAARKRLSSERAESGFDEPA